MHEPVVLIFAPLLASVVVTEQLGTPDAAQIVVLLFWGGRESCSVCSSNR